MKAAFLLPLICGLLTLLVLLTALRVWRDSLRSFASQAHFGLVTLASVIVTVVMYFWNLLKLPI